MKYFILPLLGIFLLSGVQDPNHPSNLSPLKQTAQDLTQISILQDECKEESDHYSSSSSSCKTKAAYIVGAFGLPQMIGGGILMVWADNSVLTYGGGLSLIGTGVACLCVGAARADLLERQRDKVRMKTYFLRQQWHTLYNKLRRPS